MKLPILALAAVLCLSVVASAQDAHPALKGLSGVKVRVVLGDETKQTAFTKNQLQTDIEIRLRKAGIKVSEESVAALNVLVVLDSQPLLTLSERDNVAEVYSVTLSASLADRVRLDRDPSKTFFASTWSRLEGFAVPAQRLKAVRERVADMADAFINGYLAANQK